MNYLAHAYLSFNRPGVLTGNMISDFVKGKAQFDFPAAIKKGITLHRAIDEFTDFHPATARAKQYFRPAYRLYSGAFVDIVYDHFLALDLKEFPDTNALMEFTQQTYRMLDAQMEYFPMRFRHMYPYIKSQNWLFHYRSEQGLSNSFGGLVRRATYLHESEEAFAIFLENYVALRNQYESFFPELKEFVKRWLEEHDPPFDTTSPREVQS